MTVRPLWPPGGVTGARSLPTVGFVLDLIPDVLAAPPATGNFAGIEETERRLLHAGFTDIDVGLIPDAARFTADQFRSYLTTVVLRPHLNRLRDADRAEFVQAIVDRLPEPVVDYVRLTIRGRKAS